MEIDMPEQSRQRPRRDLSGFPDMRALMADQHKLVPVALYSLFLIGRDMCDQKIEQTPLLTTVRKLAINCINSGEAAHILGCNGCGSDAVVSCRTMIETAIVAHYMEIAPTALEDFENFHRIKLHNHYLMKQKNRRDFRPED